MERDSGLTVWTVGTSNRSLEEFVELLRWLGVGVAVDARRFPASSRFDWFRKDALRRSLEEAGIRYVHLEGLGGYRSGGYEKYMGAEEFRRAFEELLKLVESGRGVAVFCSERLFFRCHRRFIADELVRRGVRVFHVVDKGKVQEHRLKGRNRRK